MGKTDVRKKGWFIIPGVQDGDRTLEEQIKGIENALAEAKGKTVLDLGCAEGLIGREFVQAGAVSVHGVDSVGGHIAVARDQCQGLPMTFEIADLRSVCAIKLKEGDIKQYDIVLSLGVAHKLEFPADGIRYAARASSDLVLVGLTAYGEAKDGILRSKHWRDNTCNVFEIMRAEGFRDFQISPRSRGETVIYWRRN